MDIETGFLYTCNETCEKNVSAVSATSQKPIIVGIRPTEANGSHALFATEHGWCGVAYKQRAASKDPPQWRCTSHRQPMIGESTKWLFHHDHNHAQYIQAHSSQKSSSCQSHAGHQNRESRAKNDVSVVICPTRNTSHHFHA